MCVRRFRDRETASMDMSQTQLKIDNNEKCCILTLDLCKAFDTAHSALVFQFRVTQTLHKPNHLLDLSPLYKLKFCLFIHSVKNEIIK